MDTNDRPTPNATPRDTSGDTPGAASSDHDRENVSWLRRGPGYVVIGALAFVVVIAGFVAVAANHYRNQQNQPPRLTGVPASVSTSIADLMALSPLPSKVAPDFTLVNQKGRTTSLASLRGKAVVLEFMDPKCTDICPIVSQEFVDAYHDLGAKAQHVVFVAVNVNQYHERVADVAAFSREHQLNTISSWLFLTGSTAALQAVWHNYGIEVISRGPNADVVHTSSIYFIDPSGHERFLANPVVDHTSAGASFLPGGQITSWGQGISLTARALIPS
ncbi:MAG: SCO family protein [Acidobacteria bacterium]|nr:SCO family protein [Acidobacteriota bacterium]